MSNQDTVNALLRNELRYFIQRTFQHVCPGTEYLHGWHIDALAHHLMLCFERKITRLVITIPPRYLKSIASSVAFPAFALGHDPSLRFICASYAQELALKHSLDCRSAMTAPWYQQAFPGTTLAAQPNTQTSFDTTKHGGRLATSVSGALTGLGADFIIVDDAHKADEVHSETKRLAVLDWFHQTVSTRLNNKNDGVIIVIQQRLHEDDLAGHLLDTGGWTHLNLAGIAEVDEAIPIGPDKVHYRKAGDALHPERESLERLQQLKLEMGHLVFEAQYQQNPTPPGGAIVQWPWFKFYSRPLLIAGGWVIQCWDTAYVAGEGNDYTVCTTWLFKEGHSYLLHMLREKLEWPALSNLLPQHAVAWGANEVIVEASGAGFSLFQKYRGSELFRMRHYRPKGDKVTRMMQETPAIEQGRVFLPEDAPWLPEFQYEMTKFPKAKHDDIVDTTSQYLYRVRLGYVPDASDSGFGWTPAEGLPNLPTSNNVGGLYI